MDASVFRHHCSIFLLIANIYFVLARIESAIDAEGAKEDHDGRDHDHHHDHDHEHDHHHHHDHDHGKLIYLITRANIHHTSHAYYHVHI